MSRTRPKFTPTPRILSDFQTACRINRSESWFGRNRPRLEAEGFPRFDPLLGGTDGDAIDAWLDQRSGLATVREEQLSDPGLAERLEAMRDGKDPGAAPPR